VLKSRHTVGSINHTEPKTEQIRKKGLKTKKRYSRNNRCWYLVHEQHWCNRFYKTRVPQKRQYYGYIALF